MQGFLQASSALLGAILAVWACRSAGSLVLQTVGFKLKREERGAISFVLGASVVHLCMFAIFAAQVAYWPVIVAMMLGWIWLGSRCSAETDGNLPVLPAGIRGPAWVVFGIFGVLYLFNAWAPEISPDGSGYHLTLVARYLRHHGFEPVHTTIYANLSGGIEMIFAAAFAVGKHSAAALVHLAFLGALAHMIFNWGRRIGRPWVGFAASALVFASPVVGIDATSAYNDVATAAVVFAAFYLATAWDSSWSVRAFVPLGLLGGYAFADKYTAVLILPFVAIYAAIRAKKLVPVLVIAVAAAVMIAPWVGKNLIYVHNPVAPFENRVFPNSEVHLSFEDGYREYLSNYGLKDLRALPLELTVRGAITQGLLGPVFLAFPLLLLGLRDRWGRVAAAAAIVVGALYFQNVGTRFLIPVLPFLSLAMLLGLPDSPKFLAGLAIAHGLSCWPSVAQRYAAENTWMLHRIPWKEALRIIPQDKDLRSVAPTYVYARALDEVVPSGGKVLSLYGVASAYTSREVLISFESAFNQSLYDSLSMGWSLDYQPLVLRTSHFAPVRTKKLRIVQTATPKTDMWSLHEVRFFNQGTEIARQKSWRISSSANPWEIERAFDGSPASRWRTWDKARPGTYVEVTWPEETSVDEVRIDMSPDYNEIKMEIQAMDSSGTWRKIAGDPETVPQPLHANIRRAASYELRAHGVNYLLIGDTEWGSEDMREDPESWGMRELWKGLGFRIYEVLP